MPTVTKKTCAGCHRTFGCGVNSIESCWCASLPPVSTDPDPAFDCLCPECLAKQLAKSPSPDESALVEGEDYYFEDGLLVMTAAYHLKRGSCCGSGCRWCPFEPKHELGATTVGNASV